MLLEPAAIWINFVALTATHSRDAREVQNSTRLSNVVIIPRLMFLVHLRWTRLNVFGLSPRTSDSRASVVIGDVQALESGTLELIAFVIVAVQQNRRRSERRWWNRNLLSVDSPQKFTFNLAADRLDPDDETSNSLDGHCVAEQKEKLWNFRSINGLARCLELSQLKSL